jgi:hypothetical protein
LRGLIGDPDADKETVDQRRGSLRDFMQGGIHIQRLRDKLVQVCEGPETVGSHLEIMGFLGHLAFELVIGGAELISHLIEALGEVADLVGGFDSDLVCQVTAADLLNPLA